MAGCVNVFISNEIQGWGSDECVLHASDFGDYRLLCVAIQLLKNR